MLTTWSVRLANGQLAPLRGNGTCAVRFAERKEFVKAAETRWLAQFEAQLQALQAGFFGCFPSLACRLLTWRELETRVCGCPDVSVDALERIALYEGSYNKDNKYIKQLWQVLREFSGGQRRQFLGFVWGRSRLPASPTQPFTIDSAGGTDDNILPHSHTCMFQLHLPRYSSKEHMRKRLLLAIQCGGARSDATMTGPSPRKRQLEATDDNVGSGTDINQTVPPSRADGSSGGDDAGEEPPPPLTFGQTQLLSIPCPGGHRDTLADFWRRCRVEQHADALEAQLHVSEIQDLLVSDKVTAESLHGACLEVLGARQQQEQQRQQQQQQQANADKEAMGSTPTEPEPAPEPGLLPEENGNESATPLAAVVAIAEEEATEQEEWLRIEQAIVDAPMVELEARVLAAGVAPTRMAVVPANLLLLQVYRNKEASVAGVTKSDMLRARAAAVALQQSRMRVPPDLINQDAAEATL